MGYGFYLQNRNVRLSDDNICQKTFPSTDSVENWEKMAISAGNPWGKYRIHRGFMTS